MADVPHAASPVVTEQRTQERVLFDCLTALNDEIIQLNTRLTALEAEVAAQHP